MAHDEEARRIEVAIFKAMSPAKKYQTMTELRIFAWSVKRAGLKAAHPEWSDQQIEAQVREAFLYART